MEQRIALREWAVAVKALEEGRQIVVLRKGGIAEETKEFRLESPSFWLFPSFEHQKPHLVKPEARVTLDGTLTEAAASGTTVTVTSYAEVAEDIEITDAEQLRRLDDLHIWTEDYAEERLKWKKTKPLHVLLLRVYKLAEPAELPMREAYGGCKSWLTLEETISSAVTPVMDEREFSGRVDEIRNRLRAE